MALHMIRAALIATALSLLSLCVHAQPAPPPQSNTSAFVAQVCGMLSTTISERDSLQAQVAAVTKQLDEARAAKPSQPQDAKP